MRWKWGGAPAEPLPNVEKTGGDDIRTDLERRGLSPQLAERVALRVEDRALSCGSEDYETLLDGVALAAAAQEDAGAEMSEHLRNLQEIERMMNGFSKELSKLDEVLEVLTAHLRRMRAAAPDAGRILH